VNADDSTDVGAAERSRRAPAAALAMIPMIDVVFLLLIFFMCSQFRTLEGELLARLPARGGLVPAARVKPDRRPATARIFVSRHDGGRVVYRLNDVALPAAGDLFPALTALRDRHPDLHAILDGGDDLPFEHFLFAFDECLRAGIEKINLVRPKVPTPED